MTRTSFPADREAARNGKRGLRWPAPPREHAASSRIEEIVDELLFHVLSSRHLGYR